MSKRNDSTSGGVGNVGGAGGNGGSGIAGGGEIFDPCESPAPPEVPQMRALREAELRNELGVFGQPLDTEVFPPGYSKLFASEDEPSAALPFVQGHGEFVGDLARVLTKDPLELGRFFGCPGGVAQADACKSKIFDFVIAQLFRGRSDAETLKELEQVFETGQELGGDFQSGARAVLEVALQSPEFLYRPELGQPVPERGAEWAQPTGVEMASRLSFLLWDRGPDAELLALAASGGLNDPAVIEEQARRMLADPRARDAVAHFYREMMHAEGEISFDDQAPEFSPAIAALMDRELAGFVEQVTFEGPGNFAALFDATSRINGPLAGYYGLPGVAGDDFRAVALDPQRYAGILTQPAWLTRAGFPGYTNPSRRGWVISEGLLCRSIPEEPAGVAHTRPPLSDRTTRQRVIDDTNNPVCAGCHQLFDPLGFALEHLDATGRYQETEHGLTIDASGHLPPDGSSFDAAPGLAMLLSESSDARRCYALQWKRWAFGRAREPVGECFGGDALAAQFLAQDNVLELIVALTQTETFRFWKVQP